MALVAAGCAESSLVVGFFPIRVLLQTRTDGRLQDRHRYERFRMRGAGPGARVSGRERFTHAESARRVSRVYMRRTVPQKKVSLGPMAPRTGVPIERYARSSSEPGGHGRARTLSSGWNHQARVSSRFVMR